MKYLKKERVPATTREVVDKITCDSCKDEIHEKQYEVAEVTMSCRTGQSYPEGGSGEKVEFDICVECFKGIIMPLLKEKGIEPSRETEWDW